MSIFNTLFRFIDGIKTLGTSVTMQALVYPYRKAFYRAKFADVRGAQQSRGSLLRGLGGMLDTTPPTPSANRYRFPGRVIAHRWNAAARGPERQTVELTCENAGGSRTAVRITVLAADLIRVRVNPDGHFAAPFSYAVCKEDDQWPPAEFTLHETAETLTIRTEKLHVQIAKPHFNIAFLDPDGTVIDADAAGVGWNDEKVACWKQLPVGAHIYGLGEKTTRLDKHGLAFQMWNTDPQTYSPDDDPIYANIPLYLGLHEGRGYGLFFDNSSRGRFDFGLQTPGITHFEAEAAPPSEQELRYYFFYGPQLPDVLDRYTELTGRMIMPPLWALGYHQNRWSYFPEARVREIAAEFRARRIPCEAIHLDIDYMDGFRCFTWHPERFPNPGQLIADLHDQGYKVVTMIDPGIKADGYWVCQDGLDKSVFCTYPDGKPYRGPVWAGESYFPDFTSPRVREWWGQLYSGMVDLGIDGFWNDMNEPIVFGHVGDTFPDAVQHEMEGLGSDHRAAHNVYGMQMARATVEGLTQLRPNERQLVITRSLWAGTQRYNMHWLGDNRSTWPALRNVMQLTMNMGLSGIAFTGPDTGGFSGTADAELLIRWNQMSVFTPFFRNHTAKGTGDQEPWALGEECERISRRFIELRYHLLPYHYTTFWQSAQTGMPIMRPLFLPFQDDPHVGDIDDQFMFGDAFLVAPITEPGAMARRAYIPAGRWYDFWTGALTAGPQITRLDAPLDRIPLLVRAGSVVPGWPIMQHTGERAVDQLTLHVYPGSATSWLYEDDGRTWAFQEGTYRLTRFACQMEDSTLTVRREVTHPAPQAEGLPPYQRIRVELHGLARPPARIRVDGVSIQEYEFVADTRTAILECGLFQEMKVILK